jgi:hypothetical protein
MRSVRCPSFRRALLMVKRFTDGTECGIEQALIVIIERKLGKIATKV